MSTIFKISEAANIAIHSMAVIARSRSQLNAQQIASITGFSKNHTAKVLQQLAKNHLLESARGPGGGFRLGQRAKDISLLNVYHMIEGEPEAMHCKMDGGRCPFESCIFGDLHRKFNEEFKQFMHNKKLASF